MSGVRNDHSNAYPYRYCCFSSTEFCNVYCVPDYSVGSCTGSGIGLSAFKAAIEMQQMRDKRKKP